MTDSTGCAEFEDLLAEVATGAAGGTDRAKVLAHLAGCEGCRRRLEELTKVADEVLLIAPERQPPAGFESGVLARIAERATPSAGPHRRRRVLQTVAAAIVAVAIALGSAGMVWNATADERELAERYGETLQVANGRYFTAAPVLDPSGTQVGHVFLYQGEPSWLFAVLGEAPAEGPYDIVVTTGEWTGAVAECEVESGSCGAGATVDADIEQIRQVQLVGPDGPVLTATVPH